MSASIAASTLHRNCINASLQDFFEVTSLFWSAKLCFVILFACKDQKFGNSVLYHFDFVEFTVRHSFIAQSCLVCLQFLFPLSIPVAQDRLWEVQFRNSEVVYFCQVYIIWHQDELSCLFKWFSRHQTDEGCLAFRVACRSKRWGRCHCWNMKTKSSWIHFTMTGCLSWPSECRATSKDKSQTKPHNWWVLRKLVHHLVTLQFSLTPTCWAFLHALRPPYIQHRRSQPGTTSLFCVNWAGHRWRGWQLGHGTRPQIFVLDQLTTPDACLQPVNNESQGKTLAVTRALAMGRQMVSISRQTCYWSLCFVFQRVGNWENLHKLPARVQRPAESCAGAQHELSGRGASPTNLIRYSQNTCHHKFGFDTDKWPCLALASPFCASLTEHCSVALE